MILFPFPVLSCWPAALQWLLLVTGAIASGQALAWFGLPAARFLGPMLLAIVWGVQGMQIRIPRSAFHFSQSCVGLLLAHSASVAVLATLWQSFGLILMATALTLGFSLIVGAGLAWLGRIPVLTALCGMAPGAASAMVLLAEEYGADVRSVTTMQYVRVICVVVLGALVSQLFGGDALLQGAAVIRPEPASLPGLLLMMGIIFIGLRAGPHLPAGTLLLPMLSGAALQLLGVLQISLPDWLLALAYSILGSYVGLRFDRATVRYVWSRLPGILLGSLVLIALCAASAWLLARQMDKDFLSVYLATSPGGLDSMAIMAMDIQADTGLVLAMQTLRLFSVILLASLVSRQIVRLLRRRKALAIAAITPGSRVL